MEDMEMLIAGAEKRNMYILMKFYRKSGKTLPVIGK